MRPKGINVLLLEDNPHDVERFVRVMKEHAHVAVASDGAEALDRVFRRGRFATEPLPDIVVQGDHLYLARMLTNIVENALKYSANVGACVHIALDRYEQDGQHWAALLIEDDGPGIAAEHLPHLCERFYRVDPSRTHSQHTPPALVTAGSVENGSTLSVLPTAPDEPDDRDDEWPNGGSLSIRSQVGAGTICEIRLPLDQ